MKLHSDRYFCWACSHTNHHILCKLDRVYSEGIDNIGTQGNPFFDYIFKPMYSVLIFGLLPVLLVGIWFGRQIKNRENKNTAPNNV